jgi:hypothetical protein
MLGLVTSQAGAGQGEADSTSVPAVAEERNRAELCGTLNRLNGPIPREIVNNDEQSPVHS